MGEQKHNVQKPRTKTHKPLNELQGLPGWGNINSKTRL